MMSIESKIAEIERMAKRYAIENGRDDGGIAYALGATQEAWRQHAAEQAREIERLRREVAEVVGRMREDFAEDGFGIQDAEADRRESSCLT
jgi:hypothetical protein